MHKIKELSNGIKVLIEELPNLNSISMGVYVSTGSKDEKEEEQGVSHLLEHMMFKGTKKRNAKEISEAIDDVGGQINAYTSKEITAYYTVLLSQHADIGIDLLSDIILNSTFDEENLEKEKKVVIEEINMYEDVPEDLVHDLNSQFVIKSSQGMSILGTKESVSSITRETLVDYYQRRYTCDNMVISLAGRIDDENELFSKLEKAFSPLKRKLSEIKTKDIFTLSSENNIINRKTNQVHICFNTVGSSYVSDDSYLLSIISNILGGNMSSRLFQKIREDRGLCYSIYSYLSSYREGGLFTVYVGTTKDDYADVIDLIKEEFLILRNEGISEEELEKAKNQLLSSMILALESSRSRMGRMANSYLGKGKIISIDEIIEKVNKIELADLNNFANKIFNEKYYSSTIIGDL
jgi:predicted Zn-dependent peptidase